VCAFLSIKLFIHVWACAATSNPSVRCTEFNEKPEIPVIKQSMATTTTTTPKRQETQHPKQRREKTIKKPIQRKSTTTHSSKNGLQQKKQYDGILIVPENLFSEAHLKDFLIRLQILGRLHHSIRPSFQQWHCSSCELLLMPPSSALSNPPPPLVPLSFTPSQMLHTKQTHTHM
jgi:hypothetical protein